MGAEGRLADTIRMTLREDEILAMSSAIVEAAGINGAKLYATNTKKQEYKMQLYQHIDQMIL